MSIINGDSGDNNINGTGTGDTIDGGAGDDNINGSGGGDTLIGGAGNDSVSGGGGSDDVSGGDGNDNVSGGANKDTVNGNDGNDVVDGGSSNDKVKGGTGNDIVLGGAGIDKVYGGDGSDFIVGGNGADHLYGTARSNGDGDTDYFAFDADDGADKVFNFEVGIDKIYLYGEGEASLSYDAGSGNTTMTYGSTVVTFKGVDLTGEEDLFATTDEVETWSIDNYGEVLV